MRPRLYLPPPRREMLPEWLDDPIASELTPTEIADSFLEIHRLNRLVGATRMVCRLVIPLLMSNTSSVLDVGTGLADTPLAMYERAREGGLTLDIWALDANPVVLAAARRFVRGSSIILVEGDARALPFESDSIDVVFCLGLIHHFSPDGAVSVLREMWRVARRAVVVADLERTYVSYALGSIALRALARKRLTRHDGMASLKRAYTAGELEQLGRRAGMSNVHMTRHAAFLQALVATN